MRRLFSVLILVSSCHLYAIDLDTNFEWGSPKSAVIAEYGVPSQNQETTLYYRKSDGTGSTSFFFYEGSSMGLILATGIEQSDTLESALVESYGDGSDYGPVGKVWRGKDSMFVLIRMESRVFLVTTPPRANDLKYVIDQIRSLPNLAK